MKMSIYQSHNGMKLHIVLLRKVVILNDFPKRAFEHPRKRKNR